MKAMILAAGRGERMRPLTDDTPKPMLLAGDKPLIQWHVENLVNAGFSQLVINVSHLGHVIETCLGDGTRWGCEIQYSRETEPLETAGGIIQALPLLGEAPFALVNGDIWCDYPLQALRQLPLDARRSAHLVLVDNPPQHPQGDFLLPSDGRLRLRSSGNENALTYAGIAVYQPRFFAGVEAGKRPLFPLLQRAITAGAVTGEYFQGAWTDVGTPQRLQELDARLGLL